MQYTNDSGKIYLLSKGSINKQKQADRQIKTKKDRNKKKTNQETYVQ